MSRVEVPAGGPPGNLDTVSVRVRLFVWHTATMRSLHWPGPRQASAALAATGCLILAACGGGGGSHHPSAKPDRECYHGGRTNQRPGGRGRDHGQLEDGL